MQKLYVVKIGGNVIDDPALMKSFLSDFSGIREKKILVHGGGKLATDLARRMGISQAMVNGRRITDAETLKLTVMVYAGLINKQIVAELQALNVNALGLSGADLNLVRTKKRAGSDIDYGFVGDVFQGSVDPVISTLLVSGIVPVFSAITHDGAGQLLNTNADTISAALSTALSSKYRVQLNYCFDKKGVLRDPGDEGSVIPAITRTSYKKLVQEGMISKGMIPKMDNAFEAIEKGVKKVFIAHANDLLKTIDDENTGTCLIS